MTKIELQQKIREAMADRNLKAVAEKTGLSTTAIYKLMDDKPRVRGPNETTLRVLAQYLGITLDA